MDVVGFFQQQVDKWNTDNKCGFCWEFSAPLKDSFLNKDVLKNDECCLSVFITGLTQTKNRSFKSGLLNSTSISYTFILHILKPDVLDTNVYTEHAAPISESKWATILKPIKECFDVEFPFDFCEITGSEKDILSERWESRINWLDNNYTGWSISLTVKDDDPFLIKRKK